MFQAQNTENINSTWKVAVSFNIIVTTSVTRPCFTTQHQTCKTNTKIKTDFLVSDRSCPKTDGLTPHHWSVLTAIAILFHDIYLSPITSADNLRKALWETSSFSAVVNRKYTDAGWQIYGARLRRSVKVCKKTKTSLVTAKDRASAFVVDHVKLFLASNLITVHAEFGCWKCFS